MDHRRNQAAAATFAAAALILAWLANPAASGAQTILERGIMPPVGLSGSSDPFLIPWNAAAMSLATRWQVSYYHTELQSQAILPGSSDAAYVTSPVVGPLSLGFGFENVRPSDEWKKGRAKPGDWTMLTFALALGAGDFASFGAALRTYVSDDNPRFNKLTTCDLSLHIHASPYMALFFAVYDVGTPTVYLPDDVPPVNESIERTWVLGVSLRPFGKDYLTISVDNLLGESTRNDVLRTFIEIKPVRGLAIVGMVEWWLGDARPMDPDRELELQASVGLRLQLPHAGIFGAVHAANRMESEYLGFTAGLTVSGQHHPSLLSPRRYTEIPLKGSLGSEDAAELLVHLDQVRREPALSGVVLHVKGLKAGAGLAQDLVDAIDRLRKGGKEVYCYAHAATAAAAHVCSHATGFYVGPQGGVDLAGAKIRLTSYAGLLKKIGVNAQVLRVGDWKSFPEALTLEEPSEANVGQHEELLADIWRETAADIGAGRGIAGGAEGAAAVIGGGPFNPAEAVAAGLADRVIHEDELKETIEKKAGRKVILDDKFSFAAKAPDTWNTGRLVGVVIVSGTITEGTSRTIPLLGWETSGAETIVDALKKARTNPQVASVVLRVDSGGGSAVASDAIWREVKLLAKKKPVVASFGSVAASGGYYVAAPAKEIFAGRATVTGSIGLFYGKADLSALLKKIGVGVSMLTQGGERADMDDWARPYTEAEKSFLGKELVYFYNLFLDRVAEGRKMEAGAVHAVAQGRIWSGVAAKAHGLVDRNGSFLDAVDRARALAALPAWAPVVVLTKKKKSLVQKLLASSLAGGAKGDGQAAAGLLGELLGQAQLPKGALPLLAAGGTGVQPLAMTELALDGE